jgi:hypothetical protein
MSVLKAAVVSLLLVVALRSWWIRLVLFPFLGMVVGSVWDDPLREGDPRSDLPSTVGSVVGLGAALLIG